MNGNIMIIVKLILIIKSLWIKIVFAFIKYNMHYFDLISKIKTDLFNSVFQDSYF